MKYKTRIENLESRIPKPQDQRSKWIEDKLSTLTYDQIQAMRLLMDKRFITEEITQEEYEQEVYSNPEKYGDW